jgi:glutamine amidotransferase PdxT
MSRRFGDHRTRARLCGPLQEARFALVRDQMDIEALDGLVVAGGYSAHILPGWRKPQKQLRYGESLATSSQVKRRTKAEHH